MHSSTYIYIMILKSPVQSPYKKYTETVIQGCSAKKVFLEILQNSLENTCAKVSFLIQLQAWDPRPTTLLKKDSGTGVFHWILWNFWEHLFAQNTSGGCF